MGREWGFLLASPVCFISNPKLVSLEAEDPSHFSEQLLIGNFSIHAPGMQITDSCDLCSCQTGIRKQHHLSCVVINVLS